MERTLVIDNEREVTSGGIYLLSVPLDEPCKEHLDNSRAAIERAREKCEAWNRPPDITLDASLLANIASKLCDGSYTVSLWLSGVDRPVVIAQAHPKYTTGGLCEDDAFGILMPVIEVHLEDYSDSPDMPDDYAGVGWTKADFAQEIRDAGKTSQLELAATMDVPPVVIEEWRKYLGIKEPEHA